MNYKYRYLKYKYKYNNLKYGGHGARFDGPHRLDIAIKNREKKKKNDGRKGKG